MMMNICDLNEPQVKRRWIQGFCCSSLLVSIILVAVSIKKLSSTTYGVEYDVWAKTLDDAAKLGGLHVGPPGFEFIKFPSTQISTDLHDICVSRDGLRVEFKVTFQFQMPEEWIKEAVLKYRNFQKWSTVVVAAGNSAIQHSCSEFNITNFQNKRDLIQSAMFDNLEIKLQGSSGGMFTDDGVYARAVSLQLKNIELPQEYKTAVAEKQSAEEDIILARNQRNQETTKATTELLAAEEEATKIMDGARNDANITLTRALLEAEETKFALEKEKEILAKARDALKLDTQGVLSYMTTQLFAKAQHLKATTGEPAKISLKDEL